MNLEDGEADLPTISERSTVWAPTPEPETEWEKKIITFDLKEDSAHGLIIGGPFDRKIELDPNSLEKGFVRAHNMKWHEYHVFDRGDGTKFFLYSGSREKLNG